MSGLLSAFTDGLLNPILVPAHVLALVALGLFIGQRQGRGLTLLIFAAGLASGLVAIALAVGQTPARNLLLAAAALLGVLVAAARVLPPPIGWLLAGIVGAVLALDSPPRALTIAEGNATLIGTALGAGAILAAVAALAAHAKQGWLGLGIRILGSWMAASAIFVLAVLLK